MAEALIQTGWLHRGVVGGKSVHRKPSEEAARLLAAMTGEAETVKARLESFATQNPRLHAQMMEELRPPE